MGKAGSQLGVSADRGSTSVSNIAQVRQQLADFENHVTHLKKRITRLHAEVQSTHRLMNKRDSNIVNDITSQVREVIHQVQVIALDD